MSALADHPIELPVRFTRRLLSRFVVFAAIPKEKPVYQDALGTPPPPGAAICPERFAALEAKIELLNARQQIVDVYRCYTRGLNRYDLDLLYGAFWPGAQITYGFNSWPRDEWIQLWRENRYLKGLACQSHHITNETIEISGEVAHVESYLIALWRPPTDDKPALILAGRYIDRLDRRNGEWRIAAREFIPHFWSQTTSIFQSSFSEATWPRSAFGAGDKSDPCYRRPLNPTRSDVKLEGGDADGDLASLGISVRSSDAGER